MASSTRIPKAEITGLYGAMVKRFSKKMLGDVPEPVGVFWQNPPVLKFYLGLGQKSKNWHECDENLKSFAHMAVASLLGCTWCLDFGYFMAHNEGLDEAKAREVARWRESEVFTRLERDVMEYAEAMSQTPPTVTDDLSARLLEALGAPALSNCPPSSRSPTCTREPISRLASRPRASRRLADSGRWRSRRGT